MQSFWTAALFIVLLAGCSSSEPLDPEKPSDSPAWDGKVQQWGTLREVMHGEVMDGQVRLSEVTDKPHVFGIGASDKLQGEILIADSVAWMVKVQEGDRIETRQSDSPKDSAAFLAISQVTEWTETSVDQDVSAEEFDDFIQKTISQAGLDELETVPFVIEGRFPNVELHVLHGQCPFAEVKVEIEGAGPPYRTMLNDVQGLLVGFYSDTGAGRITHHWTRTHVHALVGPSVKRVAGHVDAVALKAGTIIRLPTHRSGPG